MCEESSLKTLNLALPFAESLGWGMAHQPLMIFEIASSDSMADFSMFNAHFT
jgi:hypothetical protein